MGFFFLCIPNVQNRDLTEGRETSKNHLGQTLSVDISDLLLFFSTFPSFFQLGFPLLLFQFDTVECHKGKTNIKLFSIITIKLTPYASQISNNGIMGYYKSYAPHTFPFPQDHPPHHLIIN